MNSQISEYIIRLPW